MIIDPNRWHDAGDWSVFLTVDEDNHLTINVSHKDGSEIIDCEVEWPDENQYKVRLTTKQIEDVFRNMPIHDKGAAVPIPKGEYVSALRKMMDKYKGAIRMVLDAGTGEEGYDPSDSEICDAIDWELLRMLAEDDEV